MEKDQKCLFDSLYLVQLSKLKTKAIFLMVIGLLCTSSFIRASTFPEPSSEEVSGIKQNNDKQGVIKDKSGETIIGATIVVEGTSNATISSLDGSFSIRAKNGDVLEVSYIGYESQKIRVTDQNYYEIILQEQAIEIDEVVVVGYGTQKKANLTGSVASIEASRITERPIGQASAALQGLTSGVTVTTSSGAPGSDNGAIRIRGVSSFTDAAAAPLVLIDGVEGSLNTIDPNLIESISVLKDAASSAIYGSRASSGVVLVTTKRSTEERFSVNYNAYVGWQSPTNLPDKVNAIDHMKMINIAHENTGATPLYSDDYIKQYEQRMRIDPDNYPNTDWQDKVLTGSGFMHSHFVSLSGGSKKIKVNSSFGYLDQEGIIESSNYNRFTFNNNVDFKLNDKFDIKLNLRYIKAKTLEPGSGNTAVFYQMNRIPATQPGLLTNGEYGEGWNGNNPIAMAKEGGFQKKGVMTLQGSLQLNYRPFDWLTADLTYSPKIIETDNNNYKKSITTYTPNGDVVNNQPARSSLTKSHARSRYNTLTGTLTGEKTFHESHNLKLLVGASYEDYFNDNLSGTRYDFIFPDYPYLDAGAKNEDMLASGGAKEWALVSFFGRINYDFKSRYLFEANARYDGSSRFAKGHKWGLFPSFSAAWRISEEPFFENLKNTFNNVKLRASWGELGSQLAVGEYDFASTMALGTGAMAGQNIQLTALNDMANALLTWETSRMWNIGLDFTLFHKLNITAEWYEKHTFDLLMQVDIPLSVGLNAPYQNIGKVRNRGWELMIDYRDRIGDFNYNVNFNLSDVRNKIMSFAGIQADDIVKNIKGNSIKALYGYEAIGYYQTQEDLEKYPAAISKNIGLGDIIYRDQNDDGKIDQEDEVMIGETIPRFTYGLNLGMEYKGIGLDLFLQGVGKVDGYLRDSSIQPFYAGGTAQEQHKNYWTPENRNAKFPRLTYDDGGNNYVRSSFWKKDASYLRLKNLQLSYTIPTKFIKKFNINRMRLYVAGQNLFTIDNFWDGFDVETPAGTGRRYPQVKTYTIGIDIKF